MPVIGYNQMVIGKGMLARAFSHFYEDEDNVIFASGVSNSQQQSPLEFERERNLLATYLNTSSRLVYFSTVSVYDPSLLHSPYIIHKKAIEGLILNECKRFIIFRLPILFGKSNNPHTLANFIYNRIVNGDPIPVYTKACRYLMDIDDATLVVNQILKDSALGNQIINVCFENRIKVSDLVGLYETALGRKAKRVLRDDGSCYQVPNDLFVNWLNNKDFKVADDYNSTLVEKYFGKKI